MVQTLNADWRGRRVLVTGATGIVGSWLCAELVRRGAHVVAFVLDDDPLTMFYSEGTARRCAIVRGDLRRYEDCARAINGREVEVIFHLGAQTLVGAAVRDPLETFESNVRGTYNLLEAARRAEGLVKAVVVASSDKAYGDSPDLPYLEDMPLAGRHPYDVSKSCTDLLASCYFTTYGLPGQVSMPSVSGWALRRMRRGGPLDLAFCGSVRQPRNDCRTNGPDSGESRMTRR